MLGHNRKDFWEIPESILGKFLRIIDTGIQTTSRYLPLSLPL